MRHCFAVGSAFGGWPKGGSISSLRLLVYVLAALLATATYAWQSGPAADPARASATAIDKVLADAVARGDIPGVVAMATDRRGIMYQGAFGVAEVGSGRP